MMPEISFDEKIANLLSRLWVRRCTVNSRSDILLTLSNRPWNAQRLRKVDGGNPTITLRPLPFPCFLPTSGLHLLRQR
jgi:hypothetical protein